MKKSQYVFMIGGEVISHGMFSNDNDAREKAKEISFHRRDAFVGYYKMISATRSSEK